MKPKAITSASKPKLSSTPLRVLLEVGKVLDHGAEKHGAYDWRAIEVKASTYLDATLRHLIAWWEGQDLDEGADGSGMHHIDHAIGSLMVLRDAQLGGKCTDDRPGACISHYDIEDMGNP